MNFYKEIIIKETSEVSPYFLWSKLFMQVHLAFVEHQNSDQVCFGVSFPEYHIDPNNENFSMLGSSLRVFAPNKVDLEKLNLEKWLDRLRDYILIGEINHVPEKITNYLTVSNYRKTQNLLTETKRFMRRESKRLGRELNLEEATALQNKRFADKNGVTIEEARSHYANPELQALPFIRMKSLSNKNEYSIRILQKPVDKEMKGLFNTYGLSSVSTVPHW